MRIKEAVIVRTLGFSLGLATLALSAAHAAGPLPVNPVVSPSSTTFVTVTWGLTGSTQTTGYVVQASTSSNFIGTLFSSSTNNPAVSTLTVTGLSPNTVYYLSVGAFNPGTTDFASVIGSSTITLANAVTGGQFLQVTSTTLTAGWVSGGAGSAQGYTLNVSTSAGFTGVIFSSTSPGVIATTLTVTGLSSGTTYFVEVGAMNGVGVGNYLLIGSTVTPGSGSNPPPNTPSLVAPTTSTLTATWGSPGATNGFVVNLSTASNFSGALFSATTSSSAANITILGLSPNTTYYGQVGAIYGGTTSYAPTNPTAIPTLAVSVTGAQILATTQNSIQAGWGPGAGGAEGYTLQASTVGTFTGTIFSSTTFNSALSTLTVTGLTSGTTYFVRAGALNWASVANFLPMGSTATVSGGSGSTGSGLGTVSILPANIPEGSVTSATMTFIVPSVGMSVGGKLQITTPIGWGLISPNGYVTAVTTAAATFNVAFGTSDVLVSVISGSLPAGTPITILFQNLFTNCNTSAQNVAVWTVKSAMSGSSTPASIANQPAENIVKGAPRTLVYVPWAPITVAVNQPSAGIVLQVNDSCGQIVPLGSSLAVTLNGVLPNQSTDPNARFSTTSNFVSTTTTLAMPIASSITVFYYQTSSIGNNLGIQASYSNPLNPNTQIITQFANVLNSAFSFGSSSIDNGVAVANQKSFTLTPDGDGVNDQATLRFTPSDPTITWHVVISSDNFQDFVFERWGSSNPLSSLVWDGHDQRNGSVVPNGAYTVKLEIPGLATSDTSLSLQVLTSSISGSVSLGGSPVYQAQVNAQGNSATAFNATQTDANGNYTLYGLKAGTFYNLYVSFVASTTQAQINSAINNVNAPAANQNFNLSSPGLVRISAIAPNAVPATVFGNVNLYTANFSQNVWGNVRLLAGTTTSDNGDPFNPSTWTILGVPPGNYTMHLNMQGYGATDSTFTVTAGATIDEIINLTARASVYGLITLPTPAAVPQWVSVQGTPAGSNYPTVFGGASFNIGQSTAVYSIFAVNAGTYTFAAQVTGYIPQQSTNVIVGATNLGNSNSGGGVDFSTFSVGGNISGTLTIQGDTSGQTNPMTVWLNAFSPVLGQNAFTQFQMTTSTSVTQSTYSIGGLSDGTYQIYPPYLSGFDTVPPGPQTVVVSSGIGTLNILVKQNTGQISGNITLPSGNNDYNQVHLSLQGPVSQEVDLPSGPGYVLKHLNSGFYFLIATYLTTGAQIQTSVAVTNGQTQTLNLDLSAPTFGISGTVSVQSGFTMINTSGSLTTVNTISDLLADATQQTLTLGGSQGFGVNGFQCTGGTTTVVTTARVEAFPKTFNSFNQSNRNGLANCFGVGEYNFGIVDSSGNYTIAGLTPGIWEVDVYPYFDNGTTPNASVIKQTISVVNSTVTAVNFALANGNSVSGTINLPTGITDTRSFNLQVVSDRGDTIQSITLQIGASGIPASSATYTISNLAAGNYSLVIQDPGVFDNVLQRNVIRYVAQPVQFQITAGDLTGINVTMNNASRIVGKIAIQGTNSDGTPSLTLITPANLTLLSENFNVTAQANPWVPSGFANANRSNGNKIDIDANNQFSIDGLIAGTYDVSFGQNSFGASTSGQGSLNLASYTQGAVAVAANQTLDLGTITLQPGISLSGTVSDTSGTPLANIRVRAQPSNSQNGQDGIETFTNSSGTFNFTGLSPVIKIYDFVAAPRPNTGDIVLPVPYGQIKRLAVDITQTPPPTLNFSLPPATASLTGKVVTVDGNALSFPDQGAQSGYPVAAIFVNLEGNNQADNPLGDESATALDGTFNITNLPAGLYDITVESLGYRPIKLIGVTLTSTVKDLGTLTMQSGPILQATLAKPDGSPVNTSDVQQAVAASADLSSIIFGRINSDASTNNILSINFAGFELTPKTYSILLFDSHNNIIVPPEGRNIQFVNNTDSLAKSLTFQPTAPQALVNVQKSGSDVLMTFYFSRPLRNGINDQDPTAWLSVASGHGVLTGITLSGDRRQLKAVYTPSAGEQNATLQFSAHTVDIDPSTGVEFVIAKTVTLLLGQKATAEQAINSAIGGSVSLSDALDPSNVSVPANALLNSNGTSTDGTTSYAFTFSATDDANAAGAGALAGAPRVAGMMARGPGAYLSEAYAAMQAARVQANVNPLSSFYSVLLPAGLSHTLNQTAVLTLSYDTTADPTQINVYFYNGSQYLIEQNQRTVDTVNHTISVGVSHFSTFVVLQNNAPVIVVNGATASTPDIEVFNFPNPFDLQSKTKTLAHGGTTSSITTDGTIIRYTIPAALNGNAHIDIYDVVGEKVRSLDLGVPTPDIYNYVAWDGRNSSGNKVASGVYIGELKVGGSMKFIKMAVIK